MSTSMITRRTNSIFPLHFYKPVGPDPELEGRFRQLENYVNSGVKVPGNRVKILRSDAANTYRGGLTREEVTLKFGAISGTWEGCLSPGSSFCKDNAYRGMKPCYCRFRFQNYDIAPVYIHHIPNFGLGVFAQKGIMKGEYILDYQGEFYRFADNDAASAEHGRYSVDIAISGKSTEIELDASRFAGLGRFLNHSCEPNVESFPVLIDGKVRVVVLALRDIPPFQQLCFNYGPGYFTGRQMACFCGSKNCLVKPAVKNGKGRKEKQDRDAYLKFLREHELHGPGGLQPSQSSLRKLGIGASSFLGNECEWIADSDSDLEDFFSLSRSECRRRSTPIRIMTNNEGSKISQAVKDMFRAGGDDYMDVTFLTKDNRHVKAHAFLLAGMSQYFRILLKEKTKKPGYSGTISLPEVSSATLLPIREWIYTGEMDCSVDNCMDLVTAAIRFELGELVSALDKEISFMYDREDEGGSKLKTIEFCRFAGKWRKELPATFNSVEGVMTEILYPKFQNLIT